MRRFFIGLLILVSALSLVLASTSLWTRRHVINTQVFVADTQQVLDQPAVRARIAEQVTATVMQNPTVQQTVDDVVAALPPRLQQFRPTVTNGVQSLLSAGVQRLLDSNVFDDLTTAALTSAHDQLVSGQPVQFTLGMAKARVPADLRSGLAGQVLDLVPDNIGVTIVTPADAPRLYNAIDLLKSAWWWFGLLALATLAGALGMSDRRRRTLRAWAVTTAVLGLLVLITLRVVRGPLLAAARPENRNALAAAWDYISNTLRVWTIWLVVGALLVTAITLLWGHVGLVPAVRRGARAAGEQVQRRREAYQVTRAQRAEGLAGTEGEEPGGVVAAREPWYRRFTDDVRTFVDGMDLPRRRAVLGAYVRAHRQPARWAGICFGAVVLLLWPSPAVSTLVWVVALVVLYLGLLEWLQSRAPEEEQPVPAAGGGPDTPAAALPAPRPAPVEQQAAPDIRPVPDGVSGTVPAAATLRDELAVAGRTATLEEEPAPAAPTATLREEPAAAPPVRLTPELLSGMGGRLDLLVRLGAARDAGVLTDAEFTREKDRLFAL